jgi:hypothetical protein
MDSVQHILGFDQCGGDKFDRKSNDLWNIEFVR